MPSQPINPCGPLRGCLKSPAKSKFTECGMGFIPARAGSITPIKQVAAELFAPGEVERLERGEAFQRRQVAAELPAPGEVERLERGEVGQLWREPSQFRKAAEGLEDVSGEGGILHTTSTFVVSMKASLACMNENGWLRGCLRSFPSGRAV